MCLHVGHGDGDVHVRSGDDAGARLGLHWVRITSLVKLWASILFSSRFQLKLTGSREDSRMMPSRSPGKALHPEP